MFYHRLTPKDGWLAFAGEVGVIVLGVLIALGFGQLADAWNWRSNTRQGVEDLKAESKNNFILMAERVTVQPCIEAQFDRLIERLVQGGSGLSPSPAIESTAGPVAFRQPFDRPFQDDVWNALTADGTTAHLHPRGRSLMAGFYWQIGSMRDLQKRGDVAIGRLNVLLAPVVLDPVTRNSLLTTIAEARFAGRLLTLDAAQSMAMLKALGQQPKDQEVDAVINVGGTVKYCRAQHLPLADWRARLRQEYADGGYRTQALL